MLSEFSDFSSMKEFVELVQAPIPHSLNALPTESAEVSFSQFVGVVHMSESGPYNVHPYSRPETLLVTKSAKVRPPVRFWLVPPG